MTGRTWTDGRPHFMSALGVDIHSCMTANQNAVLVYTCRSIQRFTDNAVNPCLESTYKFIGHVMTAVKGLHDRIQPLSVYHVGGDEVAAGAWDQSPACQRLIQRLKVQHRATGSDDDDDDEVAMTTHLLKTYFIRR